MNRDYLWTGSGARLQLVRANDGKNYQWFFLPGGPGLGSESLFPLINILELPGNIWCLDLPGDGSNIGDGMHISKWRPALQLFAQKEEYNLSNILMKEVAHAGHFPWIENPQAVIEAFEEYVLML